MPSRTDSYIVRLMKRGRTHGKLGPYSSFDSARSDAQALADSAGAGVKVYVEVDKPKRKRSTSTKRRSNPKLKAGSPAVAKRLTAYAHKLGLPFIDVRPEGGWGSRYGAFLNDHASVAQGRKGAAWASFASEKGAREELPRLAKLYGVGGPHSHIRNPDGFRMNAPRGTAKRPAGFFSRGHVFDVNTGQPFPESWTGYAFSETGESVIKVGRSGGERSYDVARLVRNPEEAAQSCSRPDGSFLPVPQCRPGPQPVPPARLLVDGKTWTLREVVGTEAQAKAQAKALRSKGYKAHIEVREAGIGIYSRGRAKGGKASPAASSPVTAKKRRSAAARKGAAKRRSPRTKRKSNPAVAKRRRNHHLKVGDRVRVPQRYNYVATIIETHPPDGYTVRFGAGKTLRLHGEEVVYNRHDNPKKKRAPSAYNLFVGRRMKAGDTLAQAAAAWKRR